MALANTDLLAVYKETGANPGIYKASLSQLYAQVPQPKAPALNAVLETGNTSKGKDIIIQNSGGDVEAITLDASEGAITATGNIFTNGNYKSQGPDASLTLTNTDASATSSLSMSASSVTILNNVEGASMEFQFAGTKKASLSSDGAFEAVSVDGGVYAE